MTRCLIILTFLQNHLFSLLSSPGLTFIKLLVNKSNKEKNPIFFELYVKRLLPKILKCQDLLMKVHFILYFFTVKLHTNSIPSSPSFKIIYENSEPSKKTIYILISKNGYGLVKYESFFSCLGLFIIFNWDSVFER